MAQATAVPPTERTPASADRWLTGLALAGIFAIGFWLRWQHLELSEFTRDQAWVLNRVYDWLAYGDFPFVGIQSSVGTAQGAVELYLLAIPLAISKDPVIAAGFVGLLQMLAVAGTYYLGRTYFGRGVGLVAALLYAVNPWALEYGRKVWTPDMASLFTVLFFLSLFAAVLRGKRYQLALACLWAMALFLVHPSAIFLAPLLLVVVAVYWRRLGWRPLVLGVALAALLLAPYAWYDYQQGFNSFRLFLGLSGAGGQTDLEALTTILAMASAKYFPTMMGYGFTGDWTLPDQTVQNELATWLLYAGLAWALSPRPAIANGAGTLSPRPAIANGAGTLWGAAAWWRRRDPARAAERDAGFLLLLWFVLPIAVNLRHSLGFYPHYFINVLPLPYLLIALGLARTAGALRRLASRRHSLPGWLAPAAVAAVALYLAGSQAVFAQRYIDYVVAEEPLGHYGVPLLYTQRAVDTVRALRGEPDNPTVYAYTSAQWFGFDYLSRPERPIREVDPREGLALPRDPTAGALFLLANDSIVESDQKPFVPREDTRTLERLRDLGYQELPDRAVRGPLGYTYYRFFYLSPERAQQALARFATPQTLTLDNGMRLRGYALPGAAKPGEKVTLAVLWDVPDGTGAPVGDEYNLFAHVLDNTGQELAKAGWEIGQYQHRYWRYYLPMWRAADLPVAYYEFQLPDDYGPGLLWLDLGAYKRLDYAEARWLDQSGKELPGAAKAGPLKVAPPQAAEVPTVPPLASFGSAFELQGFVLTPAAPRAGDTVDVALRWRARSRPGADYTVSVQVLDGAGKLVAQHDSPPVKGQYPTSAWEQGEMVVDHHSLQLPAGAGPGSYRFLLVVYSPASQQRLAATGPGGGTADSLLLGTVAVK
ncbi:MAG: glycosyltransferase family 39 protein [Chloroflexi bacterium]|nr:glycosyltransferase family 39 protein [Chloroflexota bacterium]